MHPTTPEPSEPPVQSMATFVTMRQSTRLRLAAIHRWLGLIAASFIVLQATTGLLIAFKDDLARWLDPAMRAASGTPATRLSPDAALDAALAASHPCRPVRLYFPKRPDGVFLLKCRRGPGDQHWVVTVDPGTGTVLRAGNAWRFPFELADELHLDWRLDRPGRLAVGLLGTSLVALATIGAIVWWPGRARVRRALRPVWRGKARAKLLTLHRFAGPIMAVPILVLASAGTMTALRPWLDPAVNRVMPVAVAPRFAESTPAGPLLPLAEVERLALEANPGASVRDIRERGGFDRVQVVMNPARTVRPRAADHVWIDRRSSTVIGVLHTDREPRGSRLLGWLLPIHTGEWLGLAGRLFMLLTGCTVLALAVTGTVAWLKRPARATVRSN